MAAPGRFLIGLATAFTLLLAGSPGLLQAALNRVAVPRCHCALLHHAHAGLVPEFIDHCHDDDADGDDADGDGALSGAHQGCPCAPLTPRCPCGGGFLLVQTPPCVLTALPSLPALTCLAPLSPEAMLLFPFVTPAGLIRPPRA
jgi:hypothetical protein